MVLYYYGGLYRCANVRERVLMKGASGLLSYFLSVQVLYSLGLPS